VRPQNWRSTAPALIVLSALLSILLNTVALAQWSTPVRISDPIDCYRPKIISCGGLLHLIYSTGLGLSFYQRSTDLGGSWSVPYCINLGGGGTSAKPTMRARGDTVVAAWYHTLTVGHNIGFRCSTDGGQSWGAVSFVLPSNYLNLEQLILTVSGPSTYLIFTHSDDRIHFCITESTDLGVSWTAQREMFQVQSSEGMDLCCRGDTLLLLWSAIYSWQELMELYFCRSTDGGESWSDISLLSTEDDHGSQNPCLVLNERGQLAAFWTDFKYSPYWFTGDVFVRYSQDLGETWTEEEALTADHLAAFPKVVWEGDSLHLTWEDYSQDPGNISYMASTDNGLSWGQREAVDDYISDSFNPNLALTPGLVHLVWDDRRYPEWGIYYSRREEQPDAVGDVESEFLPQEKYLRAYPNPFNSRVTIKYFLPSDGSVSIGIYNVSSQRVDRILSQNMPAGQHEITWEASGFPSGLYSVVVRQGNRSETARLVLVK